jgi:hypothetical protein
LGGRSPSATSALVAVLGLTALFGIVMYDLQNTQFHDAAIHRAKELEKMLALSRLSDREIATALQECRSGMTEPSSSFTLLQLPGWHLLARFGILAQLGMPGGWRLLCVAAVAVLVFMAVLATLHKYDSQVVQPKPLPPPPGGSDAFRARSHDIGSGSL